MYTSRSISTDHKDLIHDVAFDHHGNRMATCSSDQLIKIWDKDKVTGEWKLTASWKAHSGSVWKITWANPDFGSVLASCSFDRTAAVWEEIVGEHTNFAQSGTTHWARRTTLVDSRTSVMDIKFAPKSMGLLLATCSADGIVRVYEAPDVMNLTQWTLQQEIPIANVKNCVYQASCISWNPNYTRERRCLKNSVLKVNSSERKEGESRADENDGSPMKYPFNVESSDKYIVVPQAPMLAVGSDDDSSSIQYHVTVLQYFEKYSRRWNKLESFPKVEDPVHDVAFAPRLGRSYDIIAVATKDVKLYNIAQLVSETGVVRFEVALVASFNDHNSTVWRVSWNSLGNVMASSGDDGYVRVWRLANNKLWKNIGIVKGDGRHVEPVEMSVM